VRVFVWRAGEKEDVWEDEYEGAVCGSFGGGEEEAVSAWEQSEKRRNLAVVWVKKLRMWEGERLDIAILLSL